MDTEGRLVGNGQALVAKTCWNAICAQQRGEKMALGITVTGAVFFKSLSSIFSAQQQGKECQIDELKTGIQLSLTVLPEPSALL